MKRKRMTLGAVVAFVLSAFYLSEAAAQPPRTPAVPARAVSVDLATFAAVRYAKEYYGPMRVHSVETYYDFENRPTVYAVILTSLTLPGPTLDELKTAVRKEYATLKTQGDSLKKLQSAPLTDEDRYRRSEAARKEMRETRQRLEHARDFVTVLCGATEADLPIIHSYRGLPEHLTQLPSIEEKTAAIQGLSGAQPGRVYYVGKFEQYYSLLAGDAVRVVAAYPMEGQPAVGPLIGAQNREVISDSGLARWKVEMTQRREEDRWRSMVKEQRRPAFRDRTSEQVLAVQWTGIRLLFQQSRRPQR